MRATIQLCTFNRASLLERVLDACFEQTIGPDQYEVVLVNDGSTDDTGTVIERARSKATCSFTVITQENSGLARARNAGIAAASGERIMFIDDDVLVLPNFVAEHLRSHAQHPLAVVRGGAINVEDLDDLPPPVWSFKDYSGNFFWTTNVSVPLKTIRAVGGFNADFAEYGWEDIDVGLRLRFGGVRAVFNKRALVYHYKPRPRLAGVENVLRQARAQARTAVQLESLHPHWRTYLATGDTLVQRLIHRWRPRRQLERRRALLARDSADRPLTAAELRALRTLRAAAYFDELERAHSALAHR
ncbi:MAG TPA: glycosyltransferase [Candidatus Baltobacteraceae bacterium]|jgi:glycosyltransferase involved in cell wall biosynthesis|nr:glycosyltransferase [Candidatus Baltobacteraceae bacterium]